MKLLTFSLFLFAPFLIHAESIQLGSLIRKYRPKYAKHFSIEYFQNAKIVKVDQEQYLLTQLPLDKSLSYSYSSLVRTPVKRVAMTSTTYLPALELLKKQKTLIGFQGKHYIVSKSFDLLAIRNLSYKFNSEDLLGLKADLIMGYEANLIGEGQRKILKKLNLPVVLNKDFEEDGPLGRAEWIVFTASFFDQEEEAIKIFRAIEENYLKIKNENEPRKRKKVIVGNIQSGKWVTCGGLSDLGLMIKDAGGEMALTRPSAKTQTLNLEEILLKKNLYDVWLTHNMWENEKERIEAMTHDPRYDAIKANVVYNNNLVINENKSSDYWEMALQRPDLLLKDLSAIIQTEFYPRHQLRWYRKL